MGTTIPASSRVLTRAANRVRKRSFRRFNVTSVALIVFLFRPPPFSGIIGAMNSMETKEAKQPIKEKWGKALDLGFVVTPSVLLRKQVEMKLDCEDVVILLNLMSKWWDAGRLPFPRTETIAKRTGLSRRTIQRRLVALEEKGLIQRVRVRISAQEPRRITGYDLDGLVLRLQELAEGERRARVDVKKEAATSDEFSVHLA